MSGPTLAQMRAKKGPVPLPVRKKTVTLVEGQHLLARSQELGNEMTDLMVQHQLDQGEDNDGPKRPRKASEKIPKRVLEIRDEQKALYEQLAEHQVELGLTGVEGGAWHRWKEAHPPRDDSQSDAVYAKGLCNATDLFDDLGSYVTSWGGDPIPDGVWDADLAVQVIYADRRDLVTEIVDMHEEGMARAPKSRSSSPTTESSASD